MSRSGLPLPSIVVVRLDRELRIIAFNSAAEDSFGVTEADVLGKDLDALMPGHGASIDSVMSGRVVWVSSTSGHGPAMSLTPSVGEDGSVTGVVGVGIDGNSAVVAESLLSSAENRLSLIETHTNEWITLNTLEGVMVYSTPSSMSLTGYRPAELVGRGGYEFIHPDDLPGIAAAHENAFHKPHGYEVRYRLRHKNGTWIWCESYTKVVPDLEGNPALILGSSRNITQRQRAEELLRATLAQERSLRQELESIDDRRREAAALVTHDLVGSLSAVAGLAEALEAGVEINSETTGNITASARKAMERVAELRDVLTQDLRAEEDRREPVDLAVVAAAVALEFGLPAWVVEGRGVALGDRRPIEHVLHNLVSNSVKYAPDTPLEIRIGAVAKRIRCEVVDHGPGVPDSERVSIFERFARGASAGSVSGVGLGLGYVQSTVESLGGACGIEETSGGGATFWFELPAA